MSRRKPYEFSLAAGQSQPYVSSIPPLFRRGETPLYIPSLPPAVPDVDRYPSSEIHLPRKPSDMFDPSARYRLKARSHSARMSSASRLADRQKQFAESRTRSGEKSEFESFEFDPSEIYRMIEERGKFPQLLVKKARTKNVSAKKKNLVIGPSDRIGSNYTPSAKHLVLKTIRKRRKRSVSRMPHIESSTECCRLHAIERKKQKKAQDLEARSLEIRNRLELQKIESRVKKRAARLARSASLPVEETVVDESVVTAPTDRPATGPVRGTRRVLGDGDKDEVKATPTGPGFINQFPYKSCQRTKSPRKVTGHKWPYDKPPEKAPQRRVSLKRKKYAAKLEDASFDHIPSASRPSSPDSQLDRSRAQMEDREEMSKEESNIYTKYIQEELEEENIEVMSKDLLDKIKKRCNPKWFTNLMLKKRVAALDVEVKSDYITAAKKSVLDYILLDEDERLRLNISVRPSPWEPRVVRAPVPWHQNFLQAKQFCRHNLFSLNTVMVKLNDLWWRRYNNLRFVVPNRLRGVDGGPVSPQDLEDRVFTQCEEARTVLLKRWLPEVAMVFVKQRKAWASLVPRKKGESLRQVEKFFLCVRAMMSMHLRSMCIKTLEDFITYMRTYMKGNSIEGQYHDMMFLTNPMVNMSLVVGDGSSQEGVQFSPPLEQTKEIMINCLKEIVENTQNFPRIEVEIFPEYKDEEMYLLDVTWEEDYVQQLVGEAVTIFDANTVGPRSYILMYDSYRDILTGQSERDKDTFLTSDASLDQFKSRMEAYAELRDEISQIRQTVQLNLFGLSCQELNLEMFTRTENLRLGLIKFQEELNRTWNREICKNFDEMAGRLGEIPDETKELVDLQRYLQTCMKETVPALMKRISIATQRVLFLLDCTILPKEDIQLNTRVFHWPKDMAAVFDLAKTRIGNKRDQVEDALRERVDKFETKVNKASKDLDLFMRKDPPVLTMDEMRSSSALIDKLDTTVAECFTEIEKINQEETYLDWDPSSYPVLKAMRQNIDMYSTLWHTALDFHENYEKWYSGPVSQLDSGAIKTKVEEMYKNANDLSQLFADSPAPRRISDAVRSKIEKFKVHLFVLETICNPGLRERHWEMMGQELGFEVKHGEDMTLSSMIDAGVHKLGDRLQEISSSASKEFALEKAMGKMKDEWEHVRFVCEPYRESGVSILASVDDIQVMLDDHILKAQTMHSSAYIKPFEEEMKEWEDKLISMQDILDAWLRCQESWLYLEPIFNSEDIMKQMPVEGRKFNKVDRIWRNIMAKTVSDTRVLQATSQPNMLVNLQEANELLDEIMKGLNDYLEKKRLFFPRFFFLSNDELLEILSETKDPLRVQPHVRKCFEGIDHLDFRPDKFGNQDIVGMVSAEEEVVAFSNIIYPVDAKGMVEKWLLQVEKQMIKSLRDTVEKAIGGYYNTELTNWVLDWPGQAVVCCRSINWTAEASEAISKGNLPQFLNKCNAQLHTIVTLVRNGLSPRARKTLRSLLTVDVHSRDILEKLIKDGVTTVSEFSWTSQMRYYWMEKTVKLKMINTTLNYGFEYLGNTNRLVMTPLTDRCYRTLMGALQLNLGGAVEGVAGTGKTETCKDLAKAAGKQCIVFNCSDGLDYHAMGKFFKGLAQSGAWACFDEFNRIELGVLSVVAQQIHTIQHAVANNIKTFPFEGVELSLNPSCSIFITMNTTVGYSDREALPDNLKLLFRPVAMTTPEFRLIAEVFLYSVGFIQAKSLSCKIVQAYKLCAEQLSSLNHYDYGMRAVRAVLDAATKLKMTAEEDDEDKIILKAILDVNLPKFSSSDSKLFQDIIKDLFPDTQLQAPVDQTHLVTVVKDLCEKHNLQATDWFVEKICQLEAMLNVRHGVMMIGEPMSAKTRAYNILAETLTTLADMKIPEHHEFKVMSTIINPKSITMAQLYGCFDPATHEWSDGVLATTFRDMATSTSQERKWIILDGPADPAWIENLNTVLDDSKKLCLMSGEIVHLSSWMRMLFEVSDLNFASPATVSRCGMIYMESHKLGWRPLMKSYLSQLPETFSPEQKTLLSELFEWLVPACLKTIKDTPLNIRYSELHLFTSLTKIFSAVMDVPNMKTTGGCNTKVDSINMQIVFIFSVIWGLCATIPEGSKKKFDTYFRNLMDGLIKGFSKPASFKLARSNLFGEQGTIFEYMINPENPASWCKWQEQVLSSAPSGSGENLIVPTSETLKQEYFLNLAIQHELPLVLVGASGTGKTFISTALIESLSIEKFINNIVNFSARTNVNYTQDVIMSKLDRRRKGVYGPAMGKKCIIFIDDLNLPQMDESGTIPPVELLRQWIDHGYWYDKKDRTKLELFDVLLLTAMSPPGTGRNEVPLRFSRHLNAFSIDQFDDITLRKIFSTEIEWHFKKDFEHAIVQLSEPLIDASLDLYKSVKETFLPTPEKCHYMFNLRDFANVVKGIKLIPNTHLRDPNKLIRLWCHEVYRVFYDRLIDDKDRKAYFNMVKSKCQRFFKVDLSKILFPHMLGGSSVVNDEHLRSLFFGDYMYPEVETKIYDEIPDANLLTKAMEHYLNEHNSVSKAPLPLVMFRFAVEHTSRIIRIIRQKGGHALLVGMGGSGRQSLTKLATFIANYELFQIEVNKTYSMENWKNDLKKVLKRAGADGKKIVFLFTDLQIKDESFLEDVSMILTTGEVPNLFPADEKAEILERVQHTAREEGRELGETSFANLYNIFMTNVKSNLHIVLAMSPVGTSFRNRLRMFPSLINCCVIDWFTEWPEDALEKVASRFLEEMEMEDDTRARCVLMCKHFHESVRKMSEKYEQEMKRCNYVTPTSYLELILTFKSLLKGKRDDILNLKTRYEMGLGKLEFASSQVTVMQNELTALRPQLLETSDETEKLMIKIEQDTIQVEAKKEIVACDEALANEAAAAAQAIRDDCENDLAEAIPALQSAINALNTLKPSDITVVKSMKNPAPIVKFVIEAVCVMKGIQPKRKPDLENKGKLIDDYWSPGQQMLGDIKFLESLKTYDKDNIPQGIMKRIREKYVTNPYFDPNLVKKVSTACEGLCKWVRAIEVYDRVIKIVAPKKAKLSEAETELANQMDKLNEKRAQLQQVTDKLQALNDEFAAMTKKKKDLEDNIELCSQKLDRAEKLIQGLGGERARWGDMATMLKGKLVNITGDVLLASGVVAYLGAFDARYRKAIISDWQKLCKEQKIPCSNEFSLTNILGDQVQIRQWQIAGLPKDYFSVDNGVIVTNARRWALMIDPQGQAAKWIKNMEKENNLCAIKYSDSNYLKLIQNAVQFGQPCLLENVGENLDPGLSPILLKQTFRHGGVDCIQIGDSIIEYNDDFRLYIATESRNPQFPPEIAVKVTLINFMITPEGLQDQMLGILAAEEKPELEENKNKLIVESASNKKQLKEIEDKILKVLSSSQGNILEDETAIQILSSSKVLSEEIAAKQKVATATEEEIDQTRNGYRPVADHAAILFFCIVELENIDPMYKFSLPWFISIYHKSIVLSEKKQNIEERIADLKTKFTETMYQKICRSLFQGEGKVNSDVWAFLLTGGNKLPKENVFPNPAPEWLSDSSWFEIIRASQLFKFQGLMAHVKENTESWHNFYDSTDPFGAVLPAPWDRLQGLEKIVILRCFRVDKVSLAVRKYIETNLGHAFTEIPPFDLSVSYGDSSPTKPLIFILSPGSDPLSKIEKLAKSMMVTDKLKTLSLGQGQGAVAEKMIVEGTKCGNWIVLQNCHLLTSWLPNLTSIWEEVISDKDTHPEFRLWLTSYPSDNFPTSLLQAGIKIIVQRPQGIKPNLISFYQSDLVKEDGFYSGGKSGSVFQRLLFSLCFFHGVVEERRHYGAVGWNIQYEFNVSDLIVSAKHLHSFLAGGQPPDWHALTYLTADCNYGGRVTDINDRRLMRSLLARFYNDQVASTPGYSLSECGQYKLPVNLDLESVMSEVMSMSDLVSPSPLGLNQNSSMSRESRESRRLLEAALATQPQVEVGPGLEEGVTVQDEVGRLLEKVPGLLPDQDLDTNYPLSYEESLNTVLRLEVARYNNLIHIVRQALADLQGALKGDIIMSLEIEDTLESVNSRKVPITWLRSGFLSQTSLEGYIDSLVKRVQFYNTWISEGLKSLFWLPGFFNHHSFICALKQNFARNNSCSMDNVTFSFSVLEPDQDVEDGAYGIHGLYLEGARWDTDSKLLAESLPKTQYSALPTVQLKPRQMKMEEGGEAEHVGYKCPVYVTQGRDGETNTTGHSSNFIFYIYLPSDKDTCHWTNRGVAATCQVDI